MEPIKEDKLIEESKDKATDYLVKHPNASSINAIENALDIALIILTTLKNKENLKVINNLIKDYNGKLKAREVIIERANKQIEEFKLFDIRKSTVSQIDDVLQRLRYRAISYDRLHQLQKQRDDMHKQSLAQLNAVFKEIEKGITDLDTKYVRQYFKDTWEETAIKWSQAYDKLENTIKHLKRKHKGDD